MSVDTDAPPGEAYLAALARRLPLVAALTGQAADVARSPLARWEAARLAVAILTDAGELLGTWREDGAGADRCSWAGQTIDAIGDELALVVAELPAAGPRLARTCAPAQVVRRAGGTP